MRKNTFRAVFCGMTLAMMPALAHAEGDSNADAGASFHGVVEQSSAVMIKVPVNEQGQENTAAAEIRVLSGDQSTSAPADYQAAWNTAKDASKQPVVGSGGDSNTDSSTSGYGYGWSRPWYGNGWSSNNYYNNYYPSYYYSGSYYNYSNPYSYNYSNTWYNGYGSNYYNRYYYYPRYW